MTDVTNITDTQRMVLDGVRRLIAVDGIPPTRFALASALRIPYAAVAFAVWRLLQVGILRTVHGAKRAGVWPADLGADYIPSSHVVHGRAPRPAVKSTPRVSVAITRRDPDPAPRPVRVCASGDGVSREWSLYAYPCAVDASVAPSTARTEYCITATILEGLSLRYPSLDVSREMGRIGAWALAYPARLPTHAAWPRIIDCRLRRADYARHIQAASAR